MRYLLYIVLGVVTIFTLIFITGFIAAMIKGKNDKQFEKHAHYLFTQLSKKEKGVLRKMWKCFQQSKPKDANELVKKLDKTEVQHISKLFDPKQRPPELSAGKTLDHTTWLVYFKKAKEMKFDDTGATIIAGIGLNGIEEEFNKQEN